MLSRLVNFLSVPHFEDEEKNRIARILYVIVVILFIASLVVGTVEIIAGTRTTAPVLLVGDVLLITVLWLTQKGKLQPASMFLLIILICLTTVLLSIGQGVHDIGITLYPIMIIIAALLLDKRRFIVVVALILLSLAYIVFGEINGLIVQEVAAITTRPIDFIIVGTLLVLAAYAIWMLADDLHQSLNRARENENKLVQSNLELENRAREVKLSEARWRSVIENAPDTIMSITEDGTIVFSNQLDEEGRDEQKGRSIYESLLPEDRDLARRMVEQVFKTGDPITYETRVYDRLHDLKWYSIRLGPVSQPDGKVVNGILIVTDIDDQKQSRETLHASEEALRRSSEYLTALNQIGWALSTLQDLDGAMKVTLEAIQSNIPLDVFFIILYDVDTNFVWFPLLYDSGKIWEEPGGKLDDTTMIARVINSGLPLLLNRTPEEIEASRLSGKQLGDLSRVSASIITAPLQIGPRIIGVISVHSYSQNAYTQEHLTLLSGAANQVAIAIENARLYETAQRELEERKRAEDEVRELNAQLERRVLQRTVELEASNRELESFTYTVSHDLRAPVRGLHGFSQILQSDFADLLPEQAMDYLKRIEDNARLMGELIDDLLAFSHLGRQQLKKTPLDIESIAKQAFAEAAATENKDRIQFIIGGLPQAQADAVLIKQVFINLFSNAIKFSGHREKAVIEVGSQKTDKGTAIYVRDNGAGFEMQHAGKLFGVFQRLHSYDQFEGTGVGLAIVRRIVERHGGTVWAEGELDKGATFYFTLGVQVT
jgi:PAS domain S-box-containing protein